MSQTTETTTTETTPKTSAKKATAPVKTAAKKPAAVPAPTKSAKKAAKPVPKATAVPEAKPEKAVAVKKAGTASGLKRPQERILKFLETQSTPMSRAAIAEFAPVDVAACVEYIGSHIEEKRLANDTKHFPSLITLGYVKFAMPEEGSRGVVYSITAKGKQIAAKIPSE